MTTKELAEPTRLSRVIMDKTERLVNMKYFARINGEYSESKERKIAALEAELGEMCKRHREVRRRVVGFVDSIADSKTRQIFNYRYVKGMSWRAVASMLGHDSCGSAERKLASRYMQKIGNAAEHAAYDKEGERLE